MENFFAQTDTKEAKESSNETKDKDSRDLQENMMIEELPKQSGDSKGVVSNPVEIFVLIDEI